MLTILIEPWTSIAANTTRTREDNLIIALFVFGYAGLIIATCAVAKHKGRHKG
jgi:uncharacterized membrane protein YsdA (DUF1294 family)